jgi:DNA-binding IclR family transcriptional regulator
MGAANSLLFESLKSRPQFTARTVMQIGSRQPLYCTAAGKVMLA